MSLVRRAQRVLARQKAAARLNPFISLPSESSLLDRVREVEGSSSKGSLHGSLIAVKDNICTSFLPTTASARILSNFTSPFDATVVAHLHSAGAILNGKTNLDEFGMGSHSINSLIGPVSQPLVSPGDSSSSSSLPSSQTLSVPSESTAISQSSSSPPPTDLYSAGGSSGGSALATALHLADAALGTDTGGSVRLPAAYTGVVGFKPSYGLLSRWGVIAYANSLDTVGIFARNVDTVEKVFLALNRYDERDPTSFTPPTRARLVQACEDARREQDNLTEGGATRIDGAESGSGGEERSKRKIVVGVPAEYVIEELSAPVRAGWADALEYLRTRGCEIRPVSLPSTSLALSTYYVIAPAEASSNLAKYDGIRYGVSAPPTAAEQAEIDAASENQSTYAKKFIPYDGDEENPLYSRTRGYGLGPEVQRRILLGTYTLSSKAKDSYFIQAQRVRRLVQGEFDAVFRVPNALLGEPDQDAVLDRLLEKEEREAKAREEGKEVENADSDRSPVSAKGNPHGCDVLITPTAPTLPPRLEDVKGQSSVDGYMNDVYTVPASLAGLPAISVPAGGWKKGERNDEKVEPIESDDDGAAETGTDGDVVWHNGKWEDKIGIQVIGQIGDDAMVLQVARMLEGTA